MNWTILFNPLAKLPAKPILLVGIISAVIGSFISQFNHTIFDGLIDAHTYQLLTYTQAITANLVNIILPCVFLFILGRFINPKTRMIDILNTSFLYRIPIYIIPFVTSFPSMKSIEAKINEPMMSIKDLQFSSDEITMLIIFSCISLAILAYAIALLFMGFKTATNAKKAWHYLAFVGVFILCEILSKLIIHSIL